MSQGRILIVDDVPENIKLIGSALREKDFDISFVTNGHEALQLAAEADFDVILLDVMMPDMDGFEVCRQLKAQQTRKDIPVIFLTAKTESEDIVRGFKLGAVDYVTKPFNLAELVARVGTHVELKRSREIIQKQNNEHKELIHVLCHDLANPLGAIRGLLEIQNGLNPIRDEMTSAVDNALSLIETVRKIQSLDANKYQMSWKPVDLQGAFSLAAIILNSKLHAKRITLARDIPPGLSVVAESVSLVNSVICNVLSNAIKFSEPGGTIEITAGTTPDGRHVRIAIKDHGIGIPKQILDNLFNMSQPTMRVGTKGEMGTGFGMPLVKRFVASYGGTVEVESKDITEFPHGHGTNVVLKLRKPE